MSADRGREEALTPVYRHPLFLISVRDFYVKVFFHTCAQSRRKNMFPTAATGDALPYRKGTPSFFFVEVSLFSSNTAASIRPKPSDATGDTPLPRNHGRLRPVPSSDTPAPVRRRSAVRRVLGYDRKKTSARPVRFAQLSCADTENYRGYAAVCSIIRNTPIAHGTSRLFRRFAGTLRSGQGVRLSPCRRTSPFPSLRGPSGKRFSPFDVPPQSLPDRLPNLKNRTPRPMTYKAEKAIPPRRSEKRETKSARISAAL